MTRHDDDITAAALAAATATEPDGDPTEDLDKFAADVFKH